MPDPAKAAARAWIIANQSRLYLPVTAVAEVAAGIGTREAAGATAHATELAGWLRAVLGDYSERVLSLDAEAALHARALARKAREAGIVVGFADLTVACIASAHGLVVATRNLRDFLLLGIDTVDPFAASATVAILPRTS
jgi:predicted nucleic acid-binding protein